MSLRKFLFWLHLAAGLTAGAVILVMSVTGVLLAFERQVVAFAERGLEARPAETRKQPLHPSAIVSAAASETPGAEPSSVVVRSDLRAPVSVSFGRERTLFVNRYSGAVLGEGAKGLRDFFHAIEDLHRALAMSAGGKAVTGAANLAFFFLVLSGIVLWFPQRPSGAAFRRVAFFRGGLRGSARDFNWHNVLGVWMFVPLAAIVGSGVVISYPWATALVYRMSGSEPPAPRGERPREARDERTDAGAALEANRQLDRLFAGALQAASSVAPEWKSISVRLPLAGKGPATFALDEGNGARPDKRSQLLVDRDSAQLAEHRTYASQSAGQKARAWLRWIHTGEAGGVPGQILAAIASAAAVVMVWTGIALSLRRFARWRRNRIELNATRGANALEEVES